MSELYSYKSKSFFDLTNESFSENLSTNTSRGEHAYNIRLICQSYKSLIIIISRLISTYKSKI